MAITFTQADLDNLKEALVTGATEVQIGDKKIQYRSLKEIKQLILMVQEYVDGTTVPTTSSSLIQATYGKGQK